MNIYVLKKDQVIKAYEKKCWSPAVRSSCRANHLSVITHLSVFCL